MQHGLYITLYVAIHGSHTRRHTHDTRYCMRNAYLCHYYIKQIYERARRVRKRHMHTHTLAHVRYLTSQPRASTSSIFATLITATSIAYKLFSVLKILCFACLCVYSVYLPFVCVPVLDDV